MSKLKELDIKCDVIQALLMDEIALTHKDGIAPMNPTLTVLFELFAKYRTLRENLDKKDK